MGRAVNILDDEANNDHQRHGKEHARCVKEATAEEEPQQNGNRVQMQGLP